MPSPLRLIRLSLSLVAAASSRVPCFRICGEHCTELAAPPPSAQARCPPPGRNGAPATAAGQSSDAAVAAHTHTAAAVGALLRARELHYCNADPRHPAAAPGVPPAELAHDLPPELQLVGVHALVRHGDRSAVHSLPNVPLPRHECGMVASGNAEWGAAMRNVAAGFKVTADAHDGAVDSNTVSELAAWLESVALDGRRACLPGHLTVLGMKQHRAVGRLFRDAYAARLGLGDAAAAAERRGALRVVSTPYQRTVLSAAAVVSGMFPHGVGPAHGRVPIHVCGGQTCPLFFAKFPAVVCPAAAGAGMRSFSEPDDLSFMLPPDAKASVRRVIGDAEPMPPMSAFLDTWFTRRCHGMGPPCRGGDDAPGACVDEQTATALLHAADSEFLGRFSRPFSGMLAHTTLNGVVAALKGAVGTAGSPSFGLTAAHDTTVSWLATALGVFGVDR